VETSDDRDEATALMTYLDLIIDAAVVLGLFFVGFACGREMR
jgi:hypothetical protein